MAPPLLAGTPLVLHHVFQEFLFQTAVLATRSQHRQVFQFLKGPRQLPPPARDVDLPSHVMAPISSEAAGAALAALKPRDELVARGPVALDQDDAWVNIETKNTESKLKMQFQ